MSVNIPENHLENMPKTAMVMAAGLGLRMRPLTETLPKPLVKILNKPLIDYSLDFLENAGITKAVINTHYLAYLLEEHLQKRERPPKIQISREDIVLETGGGVKNALPALGRNPFFVINSDVICINDKIHALHRLWQAWDAVRMDILLLLHITKNAVGYNGKGDFFIEDNGFLRRRAEGEEAPYVFTGIQLINPTIFSDAPEGKFSLNLLYNKNLKRVGAIVHDGNWLHIGSPKELTKAEEWLSQK